MRCTKCGVEVADGSNFCPVCGHQFSSDVAAAVTPAKTSGLAVAALILGVLSFFSCGLLIIPALICGIIAAVRISSSQGRLKGMGMAITGMVLPAVALPVMAVLMAILMPALTQVRMLAQKTVCSTNLSGLGKAMILYANDNYGEYPTPEKWCDLLIEYADVPEKTFVCPAADDGGRCHYAVNAHIEGLGNKAPPDMVLLFESRSGWNQTGGPELLSIEHHGEEGANILFVDGYVAFVPKEDIPDLIWKAQDNP